METPAPYCRLTSFGPVAVEAPTTPLAAAEAEVAKLRARLAEAQQELSEQERAKLLLIQETHRWSEAEKRDKALYERERSELARLKEAIRAAGSSRMPAAEREAYASNTNGAGTRGAFGAGQVMGKSLLAQDLLSLFDL